jgi:hypothetical protein
MLFPLLPRLRALSPAQDRLQFRAAAEPILTASGMAMFGSNSSAIDLSSSIIRSI